MNERKQDEKPDKTSRQTKCTCLAGTNDVLLRLQSKAANDSRTGSKHAMPHRLYMPATSVIWEMNDIDICVKRFNSWKDLGSHVTVLQ